MNTTLLGSWELYEYYVDEVDGLLHVKEDEIKMENMKWNLSFSRDGNLRYELNLPLLFLKGLKVNKWAKSRNFIVFASGDLREKEVEFQFAFEKGILKLLKKDAQGRIEIFAFFRRLKLKKEAPK